jgi:hypothetical protein
MFYMAKMSSLPLLSQFLQKAKNYFRAYITRIKEISAEISV